ncbi:MAG TPA: XRE family transcriptional regulator [Phototrophicaceae bacterium]|nr:XRE family transcriptional regulator [Phototrophicaceae bacterium]
MAEDTVNQASGIPNVGQRIRRLREERGLSLRALAEKCSLSLNAISKIERGENSPTVASLHLLASALAVPITEFFRDTSDQVTVFVKRSHRLRSQREGLDIESLGIGLRNQQLEPFLVTLAPGAGLDTEPITHAGQEFVYCLDGEFDYQIGAETYHLEAGDSLLFEAAQPHYFSNSTSGPALILLVFQAQDGNQARQRHLDT